MWCFSGLIIVDFKGFTWQAPWGEAPLLHLTWHSQCTVASEGSCSQGLRQHCPSWQWQASYAYLHSQPRHLLSRGFIFWGLKQIYLPQAICPGLHLGEEVIHADTSSFWLSTQHFSSPSPFPQLPAPGSQNYRNPLFRAPLAVWQPHCLSWSTDPPLVPFPGKNGTGRLKCFLWFASYLYCSEVTKSLEYYFHFGFFSWRHTLTPHSSFLFSSAKPLTLIHLRCQATFLNPRFRLHHTLPSFCPGSLRSVLLDGMLLLHSL